MRSYKFFSYSNILGGRWTYYQTYRSKSYGIKKYQAFCKKNNLHMIFAVEIYSIVKGRHKVVENIYQCYPDGSICRIDDIELAEKLKQSRKWYFYDIDSEVV